ncbi:MAG: Rne/Rng family ribonuclease [Myxococcaceae bacterium]|nr:Rne/Rng family ribonuclease [Myxococcaceae bacterium]MBH2006713.1 Rne/Rng family ribonuclease [Myxococcaceae bacterium]
MSKEIIINADMAEEVRIAIVENGRLVDLDIETQKRAKHKSNIYKGIVSNIEDSLEAVFVDFGDEKQGFLPLSEIRPDLIPESCRNSKKVRPSEILSRGQEIVVQVTKDEIGNKGAALSTYLSLPGRYVVLMHSDEGGGGISRKIDNESARQAARDMLTRLSVPEGMAVIIRTAGMTANRQDLYRDFKNLCETWQQINRGAELGRAPTLLYREPDIVVRTLRDYFSNDVSKVVIDDDEEFEEVSNYLTQHMPGLVQILEQHKKKDPIFFHYGIEKAIEDLFERQVKLPSGGYVVIEQTEALVSVDVNSGKSTKEDDHEATVYKTNLEAVQELARQLRLRDLGGIIVIDLIDMISGKHNRDVERALKEAMKNDKARIKIGRIGENGTLELTRQRLRQSHRLISHVTCKQCEGTGRVRDSSGLAILALRNIYGHLSKRHHHLSLLTVKMPVDVANQLNNSKRRELVDIGERYQVQLHILGDARLMGDELDFLEERRGQAGLDAASTQPKVSQKPHRNALRMPPPSIGPAPTLIDFDETLDESEEPIELERPIVEEHFEDPLMEAFFGHAPELQASLGMEFQEPDSVDETQLASKPKRRRRRFARSRRPKSEVTS